MLIPLLFTNKYKPINFGEIALGKHAGQFNSEVTVDLITFYGSKNIKTKEEFDSPASCVLDWSINIRIKAI